MKPKPLYGTPTLAMIDALSDMGMSMKDAAGILLADDGTIPRRYAADATRRSILTKRLKQTRPGMLGPKDFDDFGASVPRLLDALVATARGGASGRRRDADADAAVNGVLNRLAGTAAESMERALRNYSLDVDAFDETLDAIMGAPLDSPRDRLELALTLFVATGCLSDPRTAAELARARARDARGIALDAPEKDEGAQQDGTACESLCLLRITGRDAIGRQHTITPRAAGCMIGSAPSFPGPTIVDVDSSTAPNHLRIYHEGRRWWAERQDRAGCTTVIRDESGSERRIPLEPLRPVQIMPSDALVLGSTVFRVMRFRRS